MKKLFSILAFCFSLTLLVGEAFSVITPVYCDPDAPTSGAFGELMEQTSTALDSGTEKAGKLASSICIAVCIVCLILLMFTKDSRKTGAYIGMIITAVLAFIGIFIFRNGWAIKAITDFAEKFFPGS